MENELKLKVVILGGTNIGKTCIISQYVNGIFDTTEPVTSNACYKKKILTIKELQFHFFFGILLV